MNQPLLCRTETLSTQEIFARAAANIKPQLPPTLHAPPPLTNSAIKQVLATSTPKPPPPAKSQRITKAMIPRVCKQTISPQECHDTMPPLLDGNDSDDESDDNNNIPRLSEQQPHLTKSMNPRYFDKSAIGKAWQAQKQQTFGKDNLLQTYTTEPVLFHIILPILKQGFLISDDVQHLLRASAPISKLWSEYQ